MDRAILHFSPFPLDRVTVIILRQAAAMELPSDDESGLEICPAIPVDAKQQFETPEGKKALPSPSHGQEFLANVLTAIFSLCYFTFEMPHRERNTILMPPT
jgi:hypothetical protein